MHNSLVLTVSEGKRVIVHALTYQFATERETTMTRLLDQSTEQRFIQIGIDWENFKAIQTGFADSPGVQLFYYQGELELLSTSPEHEIVKGNIGFLVEDICLI